MAGGLAVFVAEGVAVVAEGVVVVAEREGVAAAFLGIMKYDVNA
jgi:hypothetical protein